MNSTMGSVSEEDEEFYFLDNFEKRDSLVSKLSNKKCAYMKYTKIPNFGIDIKVKSKTACVPQPNPRIRRHVTIDTDVKDTTRSLKVSESSDNKKPIRKLSPCGTLEDNQKNLDKPNTRNIIKKPEKKQQRKFWCSSNRATQAEISSKQTDIGENKNEPPLLTAQFDSQTSLLNENLLKKEPMSQSKSCALPLKKTDSRTSLDVDILKKRVTNSQSVNIPSKKTTKPQQKIKVSYLSYNNVSTEPMSFDRIDIPLGDGNSVKRLLHDIIEDPYSDECCAKNRDQEIQYHVQSHDSALQYLYKTERLSVDQYTNMEDFRIHHDFSTNTELLQVSVSTNTKKEVLHTSHTNTAKEDLHAATNTETNQWHAFTNTEKDENNAYTNTHTDAANVHTNTDKDLYRKHAGTKLFDSLHIPDVSLSYDRSVSYYGNSVSLPSLVSTSVNDPTQSDLKLSHCPMSVVSVFKTVMKKREDKVFVPYCASQKSNKSNENNGGNVVSRNRLLEFSSHKVVSPSDFVGGIRLDSGLLSGDMISDQFRMELNFIDSFFDSLRYLENCSLSNKIMDSDIKSDNWKSCTSEFNSSEYHDFLSKLENNNQSYTMASKSLFLLNLLIRDEQRRAQNLLFVLKMRENALKDFTKSQIIWLENRKKQESTEVSTLKKKQRGALLKLQYECGEMQRMRKALVALSEKRRAALLKTKKNIELKLKKGVGVDDLIQSKKKLRKLTSDRTNVPLKCFELSSSGCEISIKSPSSSSHKVDSPPADPDTNVMVDGGYLNILFQDVKLPQIFSSGKQYEVSREALKAIIDTNEVKRDEVKREEVKRDEVRRDDVKRDGVKRDEVNCDEVKRDEVKRVELPVAEPPPKSVETSTPSTARSLVDEFFQYYHDMGKECSSKEDTSECDSHGMDTKEVELPDDKLNYIDLNIKDSKEDSIMSHEGPLPVPAGADADVMDAYRVDRRYSDNSFYTMSIPEDSLTGSEHSLEPVVVPKENSISKINLSDVSVELYNSHPSESEAETLRQQQIAIEKEIKALEQQQLIVREIPDKPPPPYTPPLEAKSKSPWRPQQDPKVEEYLRKALSGETLNTEDSFECFCYDYCQERAGSQKERDSELPWCSSLQKQSVKVTTATDTMVIKNTTADLEEMFTVPPPVAITGQTSRRIDHVDNILFNEWRRYEPQWTSFHCDENTVKNQVFNSIFDKVLTQTVDEYKKIVMGD